MTTAILNWTSAAWMQRTLQRRGITTRDGLLFDNGCVMQVYSADRLAIAFGFRCAEQLVRAMEQMKKDKLKAQHYP